MSMSGIKSKPVYPGLSPDAGATNHVLVGEGSGIEVLARLRRELTELGCGTALKGDQVAVFCITGSSLEHGQALLGGGLPNQFPDSDALCGALTEYLASLGMGARLYVAGSEGFLWRVVTSARDGAGMSEAAIQLELCGPPARPVCCVHCKTTEPAVATTIYQCQGCGLNLFVRDHFSRRLGAYQGLCVDAEAPGEVPEPEELES